MSDTMVTPVYLELDDDDGAEVTPAGVDATGARVQVASAEPKRRGRQAAHTAEQLLEAFDANDRNGTKAAEAMGTSVANLLQRIKPLREARGETFQTRARNAGSGAPRKSNKAYTFNVEAVYPRSEAEEKAQRAVDALTEMGVSVPKAVSDILKDVKPNPEVSTADGVHFEIDFGNGQVLHLTVSIA